MTLTLYSTLTRRKETFEPLEPGKVKIYCCGVTVYDFCHLGHARSYIGWDTVRRYLQWRGYEVRYVQNFTDIDDKIIRRSQAEGLPWDEVTATYIQAYLDDMARLNILAADDYPKATDVIPQIIAFIQQLIERGYAYAVAGDVYYAVERFPDYGQLSGRKIDATDAGASGRLDDEAEAKKRHPLDFALWKAAKPGEPWWDSPWGKGRPGWHIECSVMVRDRLGDHIDIHMGGQDLVFPHHENELAQSEAIVTKPMARYWLHNGFVNISGEKMSKSLGNFTTIRSLLDSGVAAMVLRLFVLQAHYRKPIDFSHEAIASAQNAWETLREGLQFGYKYGAKLGYTDVDDASFGQPSAMRIPDDSEAVLRFRTAMDDDFNTSGGLAVLFELAKELQKEGNRLTHDGKTSADPATLRAQWQTLVVLSQVLGLEAGAEETAAASVDALSDQAIAALVEQRLAARQSKNWAESDRIRDQLKAEGITLIDKPGGVTEWHR